MQAMGNFLDGEWESICKLFSVEEPEMSAHLLDYSPTSEQGDNLAFASTSNFNPSFVTNSSQTSHVHGNGYTDNALFGMSCFNDLPMSNDISMCMDFLMVDGENDGSFASLFVQDEQSSTRIDSQEEENTGNLPSPSIEATLKRKRGPPTPQEEKEEKTPKKKARVPRNKGKNKVQPKKDEEVTVVVNAAEEADAAQQGQSSGCDNSEDESNTSDETNEVAESENSKSVTLTSTGKKRASRGAATDPQSLYARKRRMRINERLKILQSLVPNGTKVDISTMLEEAFHYVKFLQLQIKLLSSDELWMFAPLAYNGLDIGAYRRLSPFLGY